jgi:hypothetical protein
MTKSDTKTANKHMNFENATKFIYLGKTVTNQNCIREEIKSILHSGKCLPQFNSRQQMNRLKMWQNSDTQGRHKQIRMTFMMKSRVD